MQLTELEALSSLVEVCSRQCHFDGSACLTKLLASIGAPPGAPRAGLPSRVPCSTAALYLASLRCLPATIAPEEVVDIVAAGAATPPTTGSRPDHIPLDWLALLVCFCCRGSLEDRTQPLLWALQDAQSPGLLRRSQLLRLTGAFMVVADAARLLHGESYSRIAAGQSSSQRAVTKQLLERVLLRAWAEMDPDLSDALPAAKLQPLIMSGAAYLTAIMVEAASATGSGQGGSASTVARRRSQPSGLSSNNFTGLRPREPERRGGEAHSALPNPVQHDKGVSGSGASLPAPSHPQQVVASGSSRLVLDLDPLGHWPAVDAAEAGIIKGGSSAGTPASNGAAGSSPSGHQDLLDGGRLLQQHDDLQSWPAQPRRSSPAETQLQRSLSQPMDMQQRHLDTEISLVARPYTERVQPEPAQLEAAAGEGEGAAGVALAQSFESDAAAAEALEKEAIRAQQQLGSAAEGRREAGEPTAQQQLVALRSVMANSFRELAGTSALLCFICSLLLLALLGGNAALAVYLHVTRKHRLEVALGIMVGLDLGLLLALLLALLLRASCCPPASQPGGLEDPNFVPFITPLSNWWSSAGQSAVQAAEQGGVAAAAALGGEAAPANSSQNDRQQMPPLKALWAAIGKMAGFDGSSAQLAARSSTLHGGGAMGGTQLATDSMPLQRDNSTRLQDAGSLHSPWHPAGRPGGQQQAALANRTLASAAPAGGLMYDNSTAVRNFYPADMAARM